jgi:long-chain acyl-CoA synthetase
MSTATGTTICDIVAKMHSRSTDRAAYQTKIKGQWKSVSWPEYYDQIQDLSCALLEAGLKPGDKVALMSATRWEWPVTDLAVMSLHGVVVPIYPTITADDFEFILQNSESKFLVLESRAMMKMFLAIREKCPAIEKVLVLDKVREEDDRFFSWHEFLKNGASLREKHRSLFEERVSSTSPDQIATLLYTSGTTGRPKGVVLTHTQIISEVAEAFPFAGANPDDVSLSFLPYSHVMGRIEHWGQVYVGFTMAFAESIEKVRVNLREIRPTILVSVPRIFEKVYAAIQTQMEANPVVKKLFQQALKIGLQVSDAKVKREPLPVPLSLAYVAAQKLVLGKVRDAFGGRLRFAISGGAPISSDIVRFFHACDILILEGYGLTETTAAVTVNTPYDYEFGTVGKPIGDVQIRIAPDGEILIKSKKVMREYYQEPEETAKAIEDGWFHTGDIGELTPSGNLRITDRKKDLIKTAGGKYVAPQKLEGMLKLNPLVSQVLIHGDQKKFIVALITLERGNLEKMAQDRGIAYTDYESLTQNPAILEEIRKTVAEANAHLASFETIKRFAILPHDFTVEAGELTPSLKIKRKFVDQKYRNQIEKLYA